MKAVTPDPDPHAPLVWTDTPNPTPTGDELCISVHCAGLNRADLMQRAGHYPPPPGASPILGLEVSGVVSAVGPKVHRYQPGDAVCALLAGGGYAEQVTCPESHVLPVPAGLTTHEAAALPEVYATAWLNLMIEGALAPHERVLVLAGASGVGTAAIQLCAARENPVWVSTGSAEKIAQCVALGAEAGANRHLDELVALSKQWTDGRGFDVILDPVGGASMANTQRILAAGGRWVLIGAMGGRRGELDLGRLLVKRQRLIGSVLRSRSKEEKSALIAAMQDHLWPMLASRRIRPVIHATFPAHEVNAAHALLASNQTIGKVLLEVQSPRD